MTWTIDPQSGVVSHSEGYRELTWDEFQRQEWPPCPHCGQRLDVEGIACGTFDGSTKYIPGNVACPTGHDPQG